MYLHILFHLQCACAPCEVISSYSPSHVVCCHVLFTSVTTNYIDKHLLFIIVPWWFVLTTIPLTFCTFHHPLTNTLVWFYESHGCERLFHVVRVLSKGNILSPCDAFYLKWRKFHSSEIKCCFFLWKHCNKITYCTLPEQKMSEKMLAAVFRGASLESIHFFIVSLTCLYSGRFPPLIYPLHP